MTRENNLAAVSTLVPIAQRRDWDRLGEAIDRDIVDHDPAEGQPPGLEGIKWYYRGWTAAFPDHTAELLVLNADEDFVTLVVQHKGTHTGEWQGHAPTGRRFSVRVILVFRFAHGRAVERRGLTDLPAIRRQLGLD